MSGEFIIMAILFICGVIGGYLLVGGIDVGKAYRAELAKANATAETFQKSESAPTLFDEFYLDLFSNQYTQTYLGLILYIFLALALCTLLATLAYLLSLSTSQDTEKRSEYECGFAPFDSATRLPFDVHFYLVGILFLIFDVEVALLFPWVLSLNTVGWFGFYLMVAFLFILSVGFLYEWKRGALIWPARYTATQSDLSDARWFAPTGLIFSPNLLELARIEDLDLTFVDFFLPELALAAGIVYLLTIIALELGEGRSKMALSPESWSAACVCLAVVCALLAYQLLTGAASTPTLHGYFSASCGADLLKFLVGTSTFFVLAASGKYLKEHYQHTLEYPIMVALALWFMLLLVQANHLISAFLCIVGFSLNLYVLILYDIAARPSREAGLKYYYLSTLSSGLILYGAFLLYALSGSGEFSELYMFFLRDELRYSELARAAVMLTIFGVFFKLSAVPAHLWAVEVYEGSPSPITALFMMPVKVAVLAVFIRLLTLALSGLSHFWTAPLLFVVSASLLWGAFAATYERNTKRFLGYASINQIGYLLLGLGCGTDSALRSSVIYLIVYVLMSAAFLFIFIYARRADNFNLNYTSDFRGLAKKEWLASWTLAIALFSMAGIPPLAGFYAKYVVLVSSMAQGLYAPAIVALATSLLGAFYYLRFIRAFWFEDTTTVAPVLCEMTRGQRAGLSLLEISLWSAALIGPALLPFLGSAVDSLLSLSPGLSSTLPPQLFAPPPT